METAACARIVTFANQKGGVGKTTSVVNIAASLGVLGKRVLVVDADPQGNTTSGFGINKKSAQNTIYDILIGRAEAKNAVVVTPFENLSVIPSNISLAGAEFELVMADNRESRLKQALSPLTGDYDYILIDCPPSLGILTINALVAADGLVIPMQCEYYSLEGLSQLMMSVKQIKKRYNPKLTLTGILITMYNGRLNLSSQVMEELKKYYADKLFSTAIARNIKLSEAPSFGMPVYYYDRNSKGAQLYRDVAAELTERI
ncbi:MAG: ParA family protein [Eubacteriales bacterium]